MFKKIKDFLMKFKPTRGLFPKTNKKNKKKKK